MERENSLFQHSLALLTDLYQLTMCQGYWNQGLADREAVFHLFFRKLPFQGGYAIAAGLGTVVEYLKSYRFSQSDLDYLRSIEAFDRSPLLDSQFIDYLGEIELQVDLDALPEGTVVFPQEPLIRIRGPLLQCQLLETVLLNIVNFQTLIATKTARVVREAKGDPVLEFGLRRAQGMNGALWAARASYVGGAAATSNVLAGKLFGIPVKGTHAHSWVMAFDSELLSFQAYAEALPHNCVFLVDTFDTLDGVDHAIQVGRWLKERGYPLLGIRLDSGDLGYLSIEARKRLDAEGFQDTKIFASNELDEHVIRSLKQQGAQISVWGVGTNLVTAKDHPALDGVYKLAALRNEEGQWDYKLKLSEQRGKVSNPGIHQVRRFYDEKGMMVADAIIDEIHLPSKGEDVTIVDPLDATRRKVIGGEMMSEDLLLPIYRQGKCVSSSPSLEESQSRTKQQLSTLHPTSQRLLNPHQYVVGLEQGLFERKQDIVRSLRIDQAK